MVAGLVVDFYDATLRLAIEVDGGVHDANSDYDAERTAVLRDLGVVLVRVTNDEVESQLPAVLHRLRQTIAAVRAARAPRT